MKHNSNVTYKSAKNTYTLQLPVISLKITDEDATLICNCIINVSCMFYFVDYNMPIHLYYVYTFVYVIVQMNVKVNDDTCHSYEEQKLNKLKI